MNDETVKEFIDRENEPHKDKPYMVKIADKYFYAQIYKIGKKGKAKENIWQWLHRVIGPDNYSVKPIHHEVYFRYSKHAVLFRLKWGGNA